MKSTTVKSTTVDSLNDYINKTIKFAKICDKKPGSFNIYRGQENIRPLLPKIARDEYKANNILKKEIDIITDFQGAHIHI
jgi:hypothetical protein